MRDNVVYWGQVSAVGDFELRSEDLHILWQTALTMNSPDAGNGLSPAVTQIGSIRNLVRVPSGTSGAIRPSRSTKPFDENSILCRQSSIISMLV